MEKTFSQLVVIGGGPGGYAAAFHAAHRGLEVTIVSDEQQLGGVCLKRGCIPSKTLLDLAEVRIRAQEVAERGLTFDDPQIDLDRIRSSTRAVVDQLCSGLDALGDQRGVRVLHGRAHFIAKDTLRIEGKDACELRFDEAVIATGSEPTAVPNVPMDDDRIMDSADALELPAIPERLLVIGAGYIGLEMGTVYEALGSEVHLVEMADRILPPVDADLVEPLQRVLQQRFGSIRTRTAVSAVDTNGGQLQVRLRSGEDEDTDLVDRILVAVGRRPRSAGIGLESLGIDMDDQGHIEVDAVGRTNVDHISAIGDVTTGTPLAHNAMHQGEVVAQRLASHEIPKASVVPAVVYTDPQVAWCGLTEMEAKERSLAVDIHRADWSASGRAHALAATGGRTKILADPESGKILGMGIVGRQAESMIAEGVLAIELGATVDDLARIQHAHPTLTETIGETGAAFTGIAVHGGTS